MDFKRKRVRVLVDTWCEIILRNIRTREEAVELLKSMYEHSSVTPIKGASTPPDLFDKEMISLYIVGKYGLGIDKEVPPEVIDNIFGFEKRLERFVELVKKVESYDELCREDPELCKELSDNFIARALRYAFTLTYFGFAKDEEFRSILKKLYALLPQFADTVRRFAKFYIAFKVGEMIHRGELRNKMDVGIAKNTIALDLSIPNAVPNNRYIIEVAKNFFRLPTRILNELSRRSGGGDTT